MDSKTIMQTLNDVGAIITDSHIVYTSGRHGTSYVNKDVLYLHTKITSDLCKAMSERYDANQIDLVAGPTIGGVVLSQWVTHHLNAKRTKGEILALYAEEEGEGEAKRRIFKRGYDLCIPGKTVVVVEDLLTTGGSARQVVEAVRTLGGNVVGLSVLCNRGNVKAANVGDVEIHALTKVDMDSWPEKECPLCRDRIPVNTSVGKGKAFLEKRSTAV